MEKHVIERHPEGGYVVDGKLHIDSDGRIFRVGEFGKVGKTLAMGGVKVAVQLIEAGKV